VKKEYREEEQKEGAKRGSKDEEDLSSPSSI